MTHSTLRRSLGVLATAVLALSMGACAGSGGSGSNDAGGTTTIKFLSWNNETMMKPAMDQFAKENPNIKVDFSFAPTQDYANTLQTRIAGNQAPDVFQLSIETGQDAIKSGTVRDLTNEPFMKGVDKKASAMYSRDGKIYGLVPGVWAGFIIYNKDLVKKAGYDSIPTDWDDFLTFGEKLKSQGVIPYLEDVQGVVLSDFSAQLGGLASATGSNGTQKAFAGQSTFSQAWTAPLKDWQQIVERGVMPRDVVGLSGDQILQNFQQGQVAMIRGGTWNFADLQKSGIDFGCAPFPALPGGEPYVDGGPQSPYVIYSKVSGAKLDAARKLLAYFVGPTGLKLVSQQDGTLSTWKSYETPTIPAFTGLYDTYVKDGKYFWVNWPKAGTTMSQEMISQQQLLIQGKTTPEKLTAAIDAKWQSQE